MAALCVQATAPCTAGGPPDLLSRPTGPESGGSTAAGLTPVPTPAGQARGSALGRPVFGSALFCPAMPSPMRRTLTAYLGHIHQRPRVGCQPLVSPLWTDAHLQNEWGFLFDPFLTQAWTPPPSPGVPTQERIFREDWNPWIPPRTGEPGLELRELQFPPSCLSRSS